jgi:alpha-ketoglutarate-dependent taurine dioxygenase
MSFSFFTQFNPRSSNFGEIFKAHKLVHILENKNVYSDVYFKTLAKECGIPLIYEEDPITGVIAVDKWTEIKYEPILAKDSYKSSNKFQPLHTDYGYFSFEIYAAFFYCVEQAEFGGATTFIDVDKVVSILESRKPQLFQQIQLEKIHFGRKENPFANNDDFILQKDSRGWKINWNYYRALSDDKNKTLIEDFREFLDNYIEKSGELTELKLNPGEGVFFHDRRVLHGRNSFVGNRQLNKGGIALQVPEMVLQQLNGK